MNLTDQLLRPLLSSAARPAVTHYDDAVGSRVELSVATLTNWAAKTANWLVEEFDVEPGGPVAVDLPAHWQTAGVLLGTWWCGGHVVSDPDGARVAFTGPDGPTGIADDTAVVALDPLGRGLGPQGAPNGAFDYLSDARTAGDDFTPLIPVPGDTAALLGDTADDVLAAARVRAGELGIGSGDRVLSTRAWTLPDGVLDALVAPLAAGAHVVQVSNPAKLDAHRAAEAATVDLS
ncbi:uncharacterized protein (TIGR03089 family) [Prauserella sediminis]|uniref:Uncharacterized protein (TIGR03089 family) n=1 Tax=Prauserella sediminis TaxID=577680 RepID=A0A839XJG6_9PSEU|nr:TIGR03089 family protein [Prauserella sediminis]MBB3661909.1 uncharacterized protein (TIGR03089 family) [Prauserella sediminis]